MWADLLEKKYVPHYNSRFFGSYKCVKISALLQAHFVLRQFDYFLSKTLHVCKCLTVGSIKVFFLPSDRFCSKIESKKYINALQKSFSFPLNCTFICTTIYIDQKVPALLHCHISREAWRRRWTSYTGLGAQATVFHWQAQKGEGGWKTMSSEI